MPVNRSVPDVAQKRKDWNGLISGFKASGLTDGSRAVSTKKKTPFRSCNSGRGFSFALVRAMNYIASIFCTFIICHPPQKSSAVQKVYKPALVAAHYILRYIELPAVSRKWPDMPKPLPLGEVASRSDDGEGRPVSREPPCSDGQALCQSDAIAAPALLRQRPCPLSHLR